MTTFIALLRGINVGGKNKIKMADLKSMFEAIGMSRVKTYIQSGNVLFESDQEEEAIRQKLEKEIEVTFGFSIKVILRTSQELKKVAENCPFSQDEIAAAEATAEGESLYVSFLLQEPSEEAIKRIEAYKSETEEYKIVDRDMYLLFPHSILKSKLANNLQKLDVPVTVRNWKTVNKLVSLLNEMEG
jgi:uncharacterized protein (DUF1697 family)